MRRRSPSYSPPPRRGNGGWGRSSGRGRHSGYRDPSISLFVRNIPKDASPDDLRAPFERFGPVRDVYLPRDYYTGEPRGFGFVEFLDPYDAAEAKRYMDHQMFNGREITVVFAEENRKKPQDMRYRVKPRGHGGYSGRSRSRSHSRSRSRSRSPSPRGRRNSRSYSPPPRRNRQLSRSASPVRGRNRSPRGVGRSPLNERPSSPPNLKDSKGSPKRGGHGRSRSRSTSQRRHSPTVGRSHSRSSSIPPPRRRYERGSVDPQEEYSNQSPENRLSRGNSPASGRSS